MPTGTRIFAKTAMLPDGWAADVSIDIGDDGLLRSVTPASTRAAGAHEADILLPGMPNLHSHAFQRAMAGLTERVGRPGDDFWSWRGSMYRFLSLLTPEHVQAIATQLYVEMLEAGYTSVAEFHYLHNAPDGSAYAQVSEMSDRLIAAARTAGIRLTLLPVCYQASDFGGRPPEAGQARFVKAMDDYLALVDGLRQTSASDARLRVGLAAHSLRAVPPEALLEMVAEIKDGEPFHIHIAEQPREVEACLAWSGMRPVEWLAGNVSLGANWTLVHATHMEARETEALAKSGAVAGLCPITEANLGDGLFDLAPYLDAGGSIGIGSDSNLLIDWREELRLLEYGQRLTARTRNGVGFDAGASIGAGLFRAALDGGARALGGKLGAIAPGQAADFLALRAGDDLHPARGDRVLDHMVFAGAGRRGVDVMVGGVWRVRDGRHEAREAATAQFTKVMDEILEAG